MRGISRRAVLVLGMGAVASACSGPDPQDGVDEGPLRTETEPLEKRFALLGPLSDAHWLGYDRVKNNDGRSVPGPSDIRLVGFARLADGKAAELTSVAERGFGPEPLGELPERLAAFVPKDARWQHSDAFDDEMTGGTYSGRFLLSPATGTVCFDVLNVP
ncbi:hypothetical protein ACTMTU_15180 [Streptomyces sp. OZ13]|uniref:hypothetical protein n=1 Tax=Streptomyces sp. OZ13 TaxID=3452210 RepID=UPI003F892296